MGNKNNKVFDPEFVKQEMIKKYPAKVARKRAKGIVVNKIEGEDKVVPEIQANVRTIPGIITQRGCCYAGCKGVVLGPTRDILNLTHGPIGCGFYSWLTRRNQTKPETETSENYMPYCFSTDMQDEDIVFGGEKKLKQAIREAMEIFKPKAIGIFSTCPVGLIGDDVHAVARDMREEFPGTNIFGFSCEGYKGVTQSAGHHIANNELYKHIIGENDTPLDAKFKVNMLGEYNIGGDAFEIERMFNESGLTLNSSFSGNSSYDQFARAHTADLDVVMCHRSINYMAEMLEAKFGIPWFKVNFIGAKDSAKSMRKIAKYFDDKELTAKIEAFIEKEMAEVEKVRLDVIKRTEGKTAALFVGGSRAHHYQELFKELGMKTISSGYEFGHRDDYEGRKVLDTIKVDADSRNIEELTIEKDEARYKARKSEAELDALKSDKDFEMNDYVGLMPDSEEGSLIIDDISHYETEKLLEICKPDIFCAGIKEKYVVQKWGVPLKQLHSYDYGGPYAGFKGAINFYKEIDRMLSSKVWADIKAPWEQSPELVAKYAFNN